MKLKQSRKLLILLLFSILLINIVSAVTYDWVNDSQPKALTGSDSGTAKEGVMFHTNYNISVANITKIATDGATRGYILWANKSVISNVSFVGNVAAFTPEVNLTAGTYFFAGDKAGASWGAAADTAVYPYSDTNLNWTGGLFQGVNSTDYIFTILYAWTLNISVQLPYNNPVVTLLYPANDTSTENYSVLFNSTIVQGTYNFTNLTFYMWHDNGTLFNYSINNTLPPNVDTNVSFNITNFLFDTYYWNERICAGNGNGTNCTWASNSSNFTFKYIPFSINTVSYDAFVFETNQENFTLNMTVDSSISKIGVFLNYNGSSYAATHSCSSGICNIYRAIDIPLIANQSGLTENKSFYWAVSLLGTFGTFNTTTSSYQQNVTNVNISNSAVGNMESVNYIVYNESTLNNITGILNATFKYYLGSGSVSDSASFSLINDDNFTFYINQNETFITNVSIKIMNGTLQRNYFFLKENYTNSSTNQELLIPWDTSNVIIEVKDQGLTPLQGYLSKIWRYYPSLNQYHLVASQITDELGQFVGKLVETDAKYNFEFYDGNKVLKKNSTDITVACRSSVCIIPVVIEAEDNIFDRYENLTLFGYDFTFDNATNIFYFAWDDQREEDSTLRLEVIRYTMNQSTTVCNSISTAKVSSLFCSVGSNQASYKAQIFREVNGEETRISLIQVSVGDISNTFGIEGLFWIFILLFTGFGIGAYSPIAGAAIYGVGFIIFGVIGIIAMPLTVFFANTSLVILFIWAVNT